MSRNGDTTLEWADGTYTFRFGWSEFEMLQEAVDCGPFELLNRLLRRTCKVGEISHTIRVGLIGGGLAPDKALNLVRLYVESRPPAENLMLAAGILGSAVQGAPDETPGEAEGEAKGEGSTTSPMENSASA